MTHNLIKPMPWELAASSSLALSLSEMRFVVAFVLYVLVGVGLRHVRSTKARHWYAVITGFLLIYYPFGTGVLHALVPSSLIYLAMCAFPTHCGTLAWLIAFPYLIMNHVFQASGLSWKEGQLDFTGAQMVLTLKLVAIGVCYQDGRTHADKHDRPYRAAMRLDRLPSLLEYYSYCFASGNLLAGPFFEAKEYFDFIERRGDWDEAAHGRLQSSLLPGALRFLRGAACATLWSVLGREFNATLLESRWWNTISVRHRIALILLTGFTARLKYYFVWSVAEAGLIMSGQCYSGLSQKGRASWGRFVNTRIRAVEFQPYMSALAGNWNICTGKFLRHHVYDRLTPKGRKPTVVTTLATQLTSGVWHGLFPGYWAFFATSALMFEASKVIYRYEQGWPVWARSFWPWQAAKMALTSCVLNYAAMSFLVLTWQDTWNLWRSVGFYGHGLVLTIMLVGAVLPPRRRPRDPRARDGDEGVVAGEPAAAVPGQQAPAGREKSA
ncbi:LPT1 [Auxenochlorella protothecoides x Auxenochlorella symbiontica]